ncbi:solute carrier family 46 member 3-like [Mya arenaria]|uniref:solute carrier family 46 member 3-like n=1 Tax=Mya arenaria TaxID=6604 RepID=UPI0022E1C416|nr:solute carrier family 46 member 3-like [Mya arenaria]
MDQTTVIDSDETSPLIKYEIDGGQNKPEVPDLQVPEWKTSSVAFQTSSPEQLRVTRRHWLVWPVAFLFTSAYAIMHFTFSQYKYIKLQNENFPGIKVNTTTSYCEVNESSTNFEIQQDVQKKTATWGIYFYLAGGLTSIVANLVLGTFTDRFGRKFLFIIPFFGTMIRAAYTIVGIWYNFPLWLYVPGYFIEGCTGQIFTMIQISYIYVSDMTTPGKQRSLGIVIVELAFGLGGTFSPLVAGYILKATDSFLLPFYISLGILGFTFLLVIALPETYTNEIRSKRTYTSRLENIKDSYSLFVSKENTGKRWMYIITLAVFSLTTYDVFGRVTVEGLYLLNYPFCWDPSELGAFTALRSGCQQIIGMAMIKVLHLCLNDELIAVVGCLSYGASFVLEGFATNDLMMYLVAVIGVWGLLTAPMIRSIMSQMTSPHKQGAVYGAIAAAETAVNLLSAVSSQTVYIATVEVMRGFIFLVYAAFNVISLVLMIVFVIGSRGSKFKYHKSSD